MEKCPKCKFKTVQERTVRDESGKVIETSSRCTQCGYLVRLTIRGKRLK